MPHIHTKPGQHDLTASALIFRIDTDQPKLLLHMHKKVGKLMQPGGHVELNENPWQGVLHEIEEETGFARSQLSILQPEWAIEQLTGATVLPTQFCTNTHSIDDSEGHYHTDIAYAFTVQSNPAGQPGEGESTDLRWVTYDELKALQDQEIAINIREIAIRAFEVCVGKWVAKPVSADDR